MSYEPYSLQVISKHPDFNGKSLKKYSVDGLQTVGVWGNEPFEVVFKNNTYSKVQVKLSIDGTDILTGQPANTETHGDVWVVNGLGTLTLKAWPETNQGGAQFIFTTAEKSVAVNTHGDLSSRSIIAAAVYTESYWPSTYTTGTLGFKGTGYNPYDYYCGGIISTSDSISFNSSAPIGTSISCSLGGTSFGTCSAGASRTIEEPMKSLAAVGAGQHVQQDIRTATGLVKPVLSEIVRVRYMWWNELKEALRANGSQHHPPTLGFPGTAPQKIMSLGSTPRIGSWSESGFPAQTQTYYDRF